MPELRERLVEDRIRRTWSVVVGPEAARRTQPQNVTNGCLHVVVDNSPWLQEFTLRTGELTARIADRFAAVRSLRFTLGQLERPVTPPTPATARASRALGPDDLREIDEAVAPIHDPDVKAAARRLLGIARRFATPRDAP